MTDREEVLKYYPLANIINIGCKKGNYYNVIDNNNILGKGKSKKNAWKSANRNISN